MRSPFSIKWIYLIERRSFDQKYKFSNKNDMVSAWRNFKNNFSRPLFTIIFRPEMLKFHPYSILTGDTIVGFVIFCVLTHKMLEKSLNLDLLNRKRVLKTLCNFSDVWKGEIYFLLIMIPDNVQAFMLWWILSDCLWPYCEG